MDMASDWLGILTAFVCSSMILNIIMFHQSLSETKKINSKISDLIDNFNQTQKVTKVVEDNEVNNVSNDDNDSNNSNETYDDEISEEEEKIIGGEVMLKIQEPVNIGPTGPRRRRLVM